MSVNDQAINNQPLLDMRMTASTNGMGHNNQMGALKEEGQTDSRVLRIRESPNRLPETGTALSADLLHISSTVLQHNAHHHWQWMPSSRQMSPLSSLKSSPISSSVTMKLDLSTPHPLSLPGISQLTSSSAEAVVDERLAHRPDVYLLALTQFATRADTVEVVGRQCPISSIVTLITHAYCIYRCVHFLSSSFDASSSALRPLLVEQSHRLLPG